MLADLSRVYALLSSSVYHLLCNNSAVNPSIKIIISHPHSSQSCTIEMPMRMHASYAACRCMCSSACVLLVCILLQCVSRDLLHWQVVRVLTPCVCALGSTHRRGVHRHGAGAHCRPGPRHRVVQGHVRAGAAAGAAGRARCALEAGGLVSAGIMLGSGRLGALGACRTLMHGWIRGPAAGPGVWPGHVRHACLGSLRHVTAVLGLCSVHPATGSTTCMRIRAHFSC